MRFLTLILLACTYSALAQWNTSNNNTYVTSGKVGIGTDAPAVELDVVGGISIQSNNNLTWGGAHGSGIPTITGVVNNGFYFYPNGTTSGLTMRIAPNGNVGIGSSGSPTARLSVTGSTSGSDGIVDISATGSYANLKIGLNTDYAWMQSYGSRPLYINEAGNNVLLNPLGHGNVGVGTTNPIGKFDINGDGGQLRLSGGPIAGGVWTGGPILYLADWETGTKGVQVNMSTGRVGIGTASPSSQLDVRTDVPNPGVYSSQHWSTNNPDYNLQLQTVWNNNGIGQQFVQKFNGTDHTVLSFLNGEVGIGTTEPDAMLAVKGLIHSREVKVDLLGACAPDYVFEKDYDLPTLLEVEEYVQENKHLPEVPSAAEMEANGIKLMEMNLLLLKKVEELTLYVIEQQKQIQELQKLVQQKKLEASTILINYGIRESPEGKPCLQRKRASLP